MKSQTPIAERRRVNAANARDLRTKTTVDALTQLLLPLVWEARQILVRGEEAPLHLRRIAMAFEGGAFEGGGPLRLRPPAVLAAAAAFDGDDRTEYNRARAEARS